MASAVAGFGLFAGNLVVSSDSFQKKWLKAKLVQSKISTPSSQINVGIIIFYGITRKQPQADSLVGPLYQTRERLEAACQCVTKDS